MSENEMNIAIAECCGWTHTKTINNPNETAYGGHPVHTADVTWELPLPNYCGDLNAMHEAEKVLLIGGTKQVIHATNRYTNELCKLLGCMDTALFLFTHATAAQRAEAFLRTLGKWSE